MGKKILITGGSGFIGTNLVDYYIQKSCEVLNIDIRKPRNNKHNLFWQNVDIRNYQALEKTIDHFAPEYILHMAARADLKGKRIDEYSSNTIGVDNIIRVSNSVLSIKKVVFASSMLVCKAGYIPENENDYCPNTTYGESKVIGENLVKNSGPRFNWVIVRPSSVWGPWFGKTYSSFFEMIARKRYVNFSGKMCEKTYGFIGNVVYQIDEILNSDLSNQKILYLGDYTPTKIKEWSLEIAHEFNFRVLTIPKFFIIAAALVGDFLGLFRIKLPMNSFRLANMTTDNILDLTETKKIAPETRYSRIEGNKITIEWMKMHNML